MFEAETEVRREAAREAQRIMRRAERLRRARVGVSGRDYVEVVDDDEAPINAGI